MLERTAGCLESGTLRRLLPASRKSVKSPRTLHSAFWIHGGGDLEASPIWSALFRGPHSIDETIESQQQHSESNSQDGVLLDFLYPSGTISLIRQYSGWGVERQDARWVRAGLGRLGHRLYTSSAKNSDDSSSKSWTTASGVDIISGEASALYEGQNNIHKDAASLQKLMETDKRPLHEEVYRHYIALPDSDQVNLKLPLMQYLSTSTRIRDMERITDLFEGMPPQARDRKAYTLAIQSYCKLRDHPKAISLHKEGLILFDIPAGSSELLAYLIDHSLWRQASEAYNDFRQFTKKFPEVHKIYDEWTASKELPQFQKQALALAQFIDKLRPSSISPDAEVDLSTPNLDSNEGVNPREGPVDLEHSTGVSASDIDSIYTLAVIILQKASLCGDNFNSNFFTALLEKLRDWKADSPDFYHNAVDYLLKIEQNKLAITTYRKGREVGRWVPKGSDGRNILHSILKIFCYNHSILGMQQILDDWFRCFEGPSRFTYILCMREFAHQGDAETVHALFEQYTIRFRIGAGRNVLRADDITPLLQVHAKRGELSEVIRIFNGIEKDHRSIPTIRCWNILLSAYAKAKDTRGALDCFNRILKLDNVKADDYTYGTIMGLFATRGDLEQVLGLSRLADSQGVKKSAAMVDCIVLGLTRQDQLLDAEKICEQALEMKLSGSVTRMWNYLLTAYAMRRDLTNVNRVLQKMSSEKIEYDGETYSALMQALTMVKMPEKAYTIIKEVMPAAGVQVTNFHYAIAMGGFLATKDIKRVFEVHNRMTRRAIPESASTRLQTLRSVTSAERMMSGTEETFEGAQQLFRSIIGSLNTQEQADTRRKGLVDLPLDIAYSTSLYSFVMFVLATAKQFNTVQELYEEFSTTIFKDREEQPPIPILTAMMAMHLGEGNFERVRECWKLALPQAIKRGSAMTDPDSESESTEILYSRQLDLDRTLSVYMNSLAIEKDHAEIIRTVNHITEIGFQLSNATCNQYIMHLAKLYRYKVAFKECERTLMSNWSGWQRIRWQQPGPNRLPRELRYMRKLPRYYYPRYRTFLWLARAYIELEGASAEKAQYSFLLSELDTECPKTVRALKTMPRSDEFEERDILRF